MITFIFWQRRNCGTFQFDTSFQQDFLFKPTEKERYKSLAFSYRAVDRKLYWVEVILIRKSQLIPEGSELKYFRIILKVVKI